MELQGNGIYIDGGFEEEKHNYKLLVSKFRNIAREFFPGHIKFDLSSEEYLTNLLRNYSINLPVEINEYALNCDFLPYFWMADLGLFKRLEHDFNKRNLARQEGSSSLKEIKKFYAKWVTQKNEKEKHFFALSTINLIERNPNKNNFIKYIINAIILTYDSRIKNSEKALNSLDKAKLIISDLDFDEDLKNEFLYLTELHIGFVQLRSGDYEGANFGFTNALMIKPQGVTAIIYLALTEKELGNEENAIDHINKVIELDIVRFDYAIKLNSLRLFSFFLNTAYIYSVFRENRFAEMHSTIDFIVDSFTTSEKDYVENLMIKMDRLDELRIYEYYSNAVKVQLKFVEDFDNEYRNSNNIFIYMVGQIMENKFKSITDSILDEVRNHNLSGINDKLSMYDIQINEANSSLNYLKKSGKEKRLKIAQKVEDQVKVLEEDYDERIELVEKQLEIVDDQNKYDPGQAFSTAMFYNFVISLMIFVIGGFGSGMIGSSQTQLGMELGDFLVDGMKWGGISFVLGVFVSLFTAASAISERANEKENIKRKIEMLKQQKEYMLQEMKKDADSKVKIYDKNYQDDIKREEMRIQKLSEEKKIKFDNLNKNVEKEVTKYKELIDTVYE